MEDNMEWACFEAASYLETTMRKAEEEGDAKTQLAAFRELIGLRKLANSFAEKAAPYRHSKLIAVAPPRPPEAEYVNPCKDLLDDISRRFLSGEIGQGAKDPTRASFVKNNYVSVLLTNLARNCKKLISGEAAFYAGGNRLFLSCKPSLQSMSIAASSRRTSLAMIDCSSR
jgi:hypothetical protein